MNLKILRTKKVAIVATEQCLSEVILPYAKDNAIPIPEGAYELAPDALYILCRLLSIGLFGDKDLFLNCSNHVTQYRALNKLKKVGWIDIRRENGRLVYWIGLGRDGKQLPELRLTRQKINED